MVAISKQWLLSNDVILSSSVVMCALIEMGGDKAIKPLIVNRFLGGTRHKKETGTKFQHTRKTFSSVLEYQLVEFPGS